MMEYEGSDKASSFGWIIHCMVSTGALPFTAVIPTTAFAQSGQRSFALPGDGEAWLLPGFPADRAFSNCSMVFPACSSDTDSAQSSQATASSTGAVTYSSIRKTIRVGCNLIVGK
jgi:hypothetical protein